MTKTVVLEWDFSPANYFEESIEISRENYIMKIEAGKVIATFDYTVFYKNPSIGDELHESLNNRFLGVQLLSYVPYELSYPTKIHIDSTGKREIFIELKSSTVRISCGLIDTEVIDKNGNIISDSKRDRIEKKKSLAELVTAHKPNDILLTGLLSSYQSGISDPNNELIHLYEIRDAISNKFGNEKKAREELKISKSQWSRFGALCNTLPIKQGRHRGDFTGTLRDASESELQEARQLSKLMIEAYLNYLDNHPLFKPLAAPEA